MRWMQYSCRKAAELMSLRQDEPLSLLQRWRLKMHLKACGTCHNVDEQLAQIDGLAAELWSDAAGDERRPVQR